MNLALSVEGPFFKLRPFWAFAAGLIASGGSLPLLQLFLLLFLVEGVMPAWWRSFLAVAGARFLPLPSAGKKLRFPYATPGSLAWKMAEALGQLLAWWGKAFWPERGRDFTSLLIFTLLAPPLSLNRWPGLWPVLLLAVAFGLAGVISLRRGKEPSLWKAFYETAVPWLVGHAAVRSPGWLSLLSALAFGLAAWGLGERKSGWESWPVFGPLGLLFLACWLEGQFLLAGGLACAVLGMLGVDAEKRHRLALLALFLSALALRQSAY